MKSQPHLAHNQFGWLDKPEWQERAEETGEIDEYYEPDYEGMQAARHERRRPDWA